LAEKQKNLIKQRISRDFVDTYKNPLKQKSSSIKNELF